MYFWMLFVCLALCKELWSFPRKTQHGLLGIPNLIEMKQYSFQHSTELCYTLHRQCSSQSYILDVRILEFQVRRPLQTSRILVPPIHTHYPAHGPVILCPRPLLSNPCCVPGGCVGSHCGSVVTLPEVKCFHAHSNLLNLPCIKC